MLFDGLLLDSPLEEFDRNLIYLLIVLISVGVGLVIGRLRSQDFSAGIFSLLKERKFSAIALSIALVGGLALRIYSLDFGLPDPYHPDEMMKTRALRRMMDSGSFDPKIYLHPPLLLYLSWILTPIVDLLGFFPENFMARVTLAGRSVSMILGTASIYLVYLIGVKFYRSQLVGSLAALLLAFAPLHITCSRYMKEDVLVTFMILLCVLAVAQTIETGKARFLYLAGFFAGCCIGSKYSGAAAVVIVLASPWLSSAKIKLQPDSRLVRHMLAALLLIPVGIGITMPFLFLGADTVSLFWGGIEHESRHAVRGHHGVVIDAWSQLWMFHLSRSISPGIGGIAVILALVSLGTAITQRDSRRLFLFGLILAFYLPSEWARSKPPPNFDRYILPCLPFIALLAADMLVSLRYYFREKWVIIRPVGLALIPLVLPAVQSIGYATELRPDTRRQAGRWLRENLPKETKLILAGGSVYLPREVNLYNKLALRKILRNDRANLVRLIKDSGYEYILFSSFRRGNRLTVDNGDSKSEQIQSGTQLIESNFALVARFDSFFGPYGFHNPQISIYRVK
jgi:4-amino-4-deoxy-L-arabinose transferase-like glycosyltransferase